MKTNESIPTATQPTTTDTDQIARISIRHYNDLENSFTSRPTRQSGLRISLCTAGEANVGIAGREYCVRPGIMSVQLPGTLFCVNSVTEDFEAQEFFIPKESIRDVPVDLKKISATFALLPKAPVYELCGDHRQDFNNFFTLTVGLQRRTGTYNIQSLQGVMMSLIYFVCDVVTSHGVHINEKINSLRDHDRRNYYFIKFLDLLGKHCIQERSVSFYADKLFITPKYLSTIIKETSGKSASEWINEFVMIEAKMRLRKSDNNVSEIAYQLNFSNISFFGKFFKRHTGMSPSDFKRQCSRSA